MTLRELTENIDVNTPLYIGMVDSKKEFDLKGNALLTLYPGICWGQKL